VRRPRRWTPFLLRAALTTGVLVFLLVWLPFDQLVAAMQRTGWGLWTLLVLGAATGHVVNTVKWRVLLRASGVEASLRQIGAAHAAGLFANIWLPSLVGGDVIRAGLLARRSGALAPLAAAGIVDRVLDTAALILLAGAGLLLTPAARSTPALRILGVAVLAVAAAAVATPLILRHADARRFGERLARVADRLRTALATVARDGGAAARTLALSIAVQGGFVLMNLPLAHAIGIDIPAAAWFLVWPVAKLAALAPISLGGIGVREVAQVALLAPFGIDPTLAVAQALVWESLMLTLGGLAGVATLLFQDRTPRTGTPEEVVADA
jgi:uncharacterized membrane protein YbhN (UPF0104 family)